MRTRTHFHEIEYQPPDPLGFVARIVRLFSGLLYLFLVVRLFLELVDAASGSPLLEFVRWVTAPFVAPFQGVASTSTLDESYHVVWAIVIALVVYMTLQAVMGAILRLVARTRSAAYDDSHAAL